MTKGASPLTPSAEPTVKQAVTRTDYKNRSKIVRRCAHHHTIYRCEIEVAEHYEQRARVLGCRECDPRPVPRAMVESVMAFLDLPLPATTAQDAS